MTPQLTEFFDFLRFPSVSTDSTHKDDVRACADYLMRKFSSMGLTPELHETPGHPIVIARSEVKENRPTVLIYGHYDVQPVDPIEEWDAPPFAPARKKSEARSWLLSSKRTVKTSSATFARSLIQA